ncbi:hypothetical protein [Orientia tsutsugamushi]
MSVKITKANKSDLSVASVISKRQIRIRGSMKGIMKKVYKR